MSGEGEENIGNQAESERGGSYGLCNLQQTIGESIQISTEAICESL